jgi:hypothetical protein
MGSPETRFGKALRDALLFADMAAGEERSYRHDAGFEIHSMDLCIEFAKALGVEPCSDAYYEAINGLASLSPVPAPSHLETRNG